MRLKRLLETSTFRLALVYLALFGVSALALLGFLYVATAGVLERQTAETIQAEITGLAEQYRAQGLLRLREVIERRSAAHPQRASIYLLTDPAGRRIAGNLDRWPRGRARPRRLADFTVEVRGEGDDDRAPPGAGGDLQRWTGRLPAAGRPRGRGPPADPVADQAGRSAGASR